MSFEKISTQREHPNNKLLGYDAVRERFGSPEQFEAGKQETKRLYAEQLAHTEGLPSCTISEQDWDMLTLMHLHHPETAQHCVDTFNIARHKIGRPLNLGPNVPPVRLADLFAKEGVTVDQFLRACLLHDVGKVAIPLPILDNRVRDPECAAIVLKDEKLHPRVREALALAPDAELPSGQESLVQALRAKGKRPQEVAPARVLIGNDATSESLNREVCCLHTMEDGAARPLTLDDPLLTIIRAHEALSASILHSVGLHTEALIAGAHHTGTIPGTDNLKGRTLTVTIGTLQVAVDLIDIIHLSDVQEAVSKGTRVYQDPTTASDMHTLSILVEHAEQGSVSLFATYIWVADSIAQYDKERKSDAPQNAYEQHVRAFLETIPADISLLQQN